MPLDYTTLPIDETTLKFSNRFQQIWKFRK